MYDKKKKNRKFKLKKQYPTFTSRFAIDNKIFRRYERLRTSFYQRRRRGLAEVRTLWNLNYILPKNTPIKKPNTSITMPSRKRTLFFFKSFFSNVAHDWYVNFFKNSYKFWLNSNYNYIFSSLNLLIWVTPNKIDMSKYISVFINSYKTTFKLNPFLEKSVNTLMSWNYNTSQILKKSDFSNIDYFYSLNRLSKLDSTPYLTKDNDTLLTGSIVIPLKTTTSYNFWKLVEQLNKSTYGLCLKKRKLWKNNPNLDKKLTNFIRQNTYTILQLSKLLRIKSNTKIATYILKYEDFYKNHLTRLGRDNKFLNSLAFKIKSRFGLNFKAYTKNTNTVLNYIKQDNIFENNIDRFLLGYDFKIKTHTIKLRKNQSMIKNWFYNRFNTFANKKFTWYRLDQHLTNSKITYFSNVKLQKNSTHLNRLLPLKILEKKSKLLTTPLYLASTNSSLQQKINHNKQITSFNYITNNIFWLPLIYKTPILLKFCYFNSLNQGNNIFDNKIIQLSLDKFNTFFFNDRINILNKTNVWPSSSFSFTVKRRLLKVFSFHKFSLNVTIWYYHTLLRFLENCTGKKAFLKFNPFIDNSLTFTDLARCNLWASRVSGFQKLLGPKIFLKESLKILHVALRFKDPTFLANWIKGMLKRMSFWKYRLLFRYIKYVMRYLFWIYFPELKFKGLKLRLKGKISVAGNARTRTLLYRIGSTSHSTFDNKIICDSSCISTFTGVLGFKVWFFF